MCVPTYVCKTLDATKHIFGVRFNMKVDVHIYGFVCPQTLYLPTYAHAHAVSECTVIAAMSGASIFFKFVNIL